MMTEVYVKVSGEPSLEDMLDVVQLLVKRES
ncbi:unnamed protein product, partial [Vitis vinifera]|uniref:Uncharacterized protein n=1 Tax=Vitis vinifera TaxID=29760 RepID=D7UBM8_VITVI